MESGSVSQTKRRVQFPVRANHKKDPGPGSKHERNPGTGRKLREESRFRIWAQTLKWNRIRAQTLKRNPDPGLKYEKDSDP